MEKNIETFLGCCREYWEADTVIYGAPFDSTASYRPGARFGSSAIRHESFGLETYSPYQDEDLTDYPVFDSGDLELSFGNTPVALADIESRADEILRDGKLPFLLGGEHIVTLPAVRAAYRRYPDLHIIHFDAHADLREEYLGTHLSHACVLRRCWELVGDGRIHQFCIRSGDRSEFEFASLHTDTHRFGFGGLEEVASALAANGTPVYVTIDLDCVDPSAFPGTGTPEAGGVSFTELLRAIRVLSRCSIVGADAVELAPMLDTSGASTALACKIVRETLIAFTKPRTLRRREAERLAELKRQEDERLEKERLEKERLNEERLAARDGEEAPDGEAEPVSGGEAEPVVGGEADGLAGRVGGDVK